MVAFIALASAGKMFLSSPTGECALVAGDVYIPFNYDKGRKFVSSVHAYDVIQTLGDVKAEFDITSTFMPCGTFSCYNSATNSAVQTHLCLQLGIGTERSSDKMELSFPVSEDLLETNMTNTIFDKGSETATLEFIIDLLADKELENLYTKFIETLNSLGNKSLTETFKKVIDCVGGDKNKLKVRMLFTCGNPQNYSSNNRLVFKYDENRMFPEGYDTKEDGITIAESDVCFGYTKYYTLDTCSNPNSPDVKGNQVNVKEDGLSAGGVVGIVIACVVVVAAIVVVALFFVIKKAAK